MARTMRLGGTAVAALAFAVALTLFAPLGGAAPQDVTLTPSSLTFADRLLGTTADAQAVRISNTGANPLAISTFRINGANPGDFAQGSDCPIAPDTVAPGAFCTIYVSFTPHGAGARSATLAIGDDAASSPQTIALSGGGLAAPAVQLSTDALAFGTVQVGDATQAQRVTLTNTGSATLNLSAVRLAGAGAADFTRTTTCDVASGLAPGATCTVDVAFAPKRSGQRTASLAFDDDAPASPQSVALTGTATPAPVPSIGLDPTALTFAAQTIGAVSAPQVVTVTNTGGAPLTVSSVAVGGDDAGDFTVTSGCPATIAAGAGCPLSITFTPSDGGTRGATVTVSSNAADAQTIVLAGTGVASGTYLSDGFESGLSQWDILSSPDSTVSLDSSVAYDGAASVRLTNNSNEQSSRLMADLAGGGHAQSYTRWCFRIAPGATDGIEILNGRAIDEEYPLGIRRFVIDYNAGTHGLEGYFFNEELQRLDLYAATGKVQTGRWYCAELYMDEQAQGHAELWLDGTSVGRVDGDLSTPNPYSRLYLWNQASAGTVWVDDVAVASAPIGTPGSGGSGGPALRLSADTLDFGAQNTGSTSAAQQLTLTNTGTSPVSLTGLGLDGANASDFAESDDCPASLAAAASCTASVTFTPSATGARTASLAVTDSAPGSPHVAALVGAGIVGGTYLDDDFESGSLSQWDVLSSPDSSAALDSSVSYDGAASVRLTNASNGQSSRLAADLAGGGHAQSHTRWCFRIAPGVSAGIEIAQGRAVTADQPLGAPRFEIDYNPGNHGLEGYFWNGDQHRLDLYTAAGKVQTGRWYCAELSLDESVNGRAELLLDGASVGVVTGDLGTTSPYSRLLLWNQAAAGTVWFDDVEVADAPIGPPGAGGGAATSVQLAPDTLDFGAQDTGTTSAAQTATLTNTGTGPVAVNGITLAGANAGDFAQTSTCPASLAAGASCTVSVTFAPTATGNRSATLAVADGAPGGPHVVTLAGAGTVAGTYLGDDFESGSLAQWEELTTAGDSTIALDHAVANAGTGAVHLRNGSAGQATRLMADLAGGGHAQSYTRFCFSIGTSVTAGVEIANGRAVPADQPLGVPRFEIDYNPVNKGLEGYVWNGAQQRFDMYAAQGKVLPSRWYCAELYLDETVHGGATLRLDGTAVASVTGDLSTTSPYSRLLLWNTPAAGDVWFDDVKVANAAIGPTGAGSAPLPDASQLAFSGNTMAFGSQTTQTAKTLSEYVTNQYSVPVTITSLSITGANAGDFAVSANTCPVGTPLAGNAQCRIDLTFTPAAAGSRSATLSIADTQFAQAHTIPLTGTGAAPPPPPTAPVATFSTDTVQFGNQVIKTSSGAQTVTLTNTGGQPLTISSLSMTSPDFGWSTSCSTTVPLAPGATCQFTFQFVPTRHATLYSWLTMKSNASNAQYGTQQVETIGTGISPPGTFFMENFDPLTWLWNDGGRTTAGVGRNGTAGVVYSTGQTGRAVLDSGVTPETHTRFCFDPSTVATGTLALIRDANGANLWEIDTDAVRGGIDVYVWDNARVRRDVYVPGVIAAGRWSCADIDLYQAVGGTLTVRLDGTLVASVTGNLLGGRPYAFWVWGPTSGTTTFDDLSVSTS